jgi:hypothetical protein
VGDIKGHIGTFSNGILKLKKRDIFKNWWLLFVFFLHMHNPLQCYCHMQRHGVYV